MIEKTSKEVGSLRMVFFVIAYCSWNETFYLNYALFCVFSFSFKSAETLLK